MTPEDLAPVHQIHYQWPKWGQYIETFGKSGEPADIPEARDRHVGRELAALGIVEPDVFVHLEIALSALHFGLEYQDQELVVEVAPEEPSLCDFALFARSV